MKRKFGFFTLTVLLVVGCNTQSSTNKGKGGTELTLKTPKSVTVEQNDTVKLPIKIERKNFEDAVSIKFDKPPTGISIVEEDTKIDKGVTERTFTLKATDKVKAGEYKLTVIASHADMKDTHEVTVEVKEKATSSTSRSSPVAQEELNQKRAELNATVKEKMKDIDAAMVKLRERAKTADANAKVELNNHLAELDKQRKHLDADLAKVETTTAAQWNDFSARVNSATSELAEGARKAWEKVKK
jgi:outer membrane autotransporter protein